MPRIRCRYEDCVFLEEGYCGAAAIELEPEAGCLTYSRVDEAESAEDEWEEWYRLTPLERWQESQKLWAFYLWIGGSLDPEPDTQSPFNVEPAPRQLPVDGRPGLRVLRRSGV
mgnify:CR=1 FL=1